MTDREMTKDFSFSRASRSIQWHTGFARVIYYGSIMKISLPLDIVPKQQQTDTLDGGGVAGIAYIQSTD